MELYPEEELLREKRVTAEQQEDQTIESIDPETVS